MCEGKFWKNKEKYYVDIMINKIYIVEFLYLRNLVFSWENRIKIYEKNFKYLWRIWGFRVLKWLL